MQITFPLAPGQNGNQGCFAQWLREPHILEVAMVSSFSVECLDSLSSSRNGIELKVVFQGVLTRSALALTLEDLAVSSRLTPCPVGSDAGELEVTLRIPPGCFIYSNSESRGALISVYIPEEGVSIHQLPQPITAAEGDAQAPQPSYIRVQEGLAGGFSGKQQNPELERMKSCGDWTGYYPGQTPKCAINPKGKCVDCKDWRSKHPPAEARQQALEGLETGFEMGVFISTVELLSTDDDNPRRPTDAGAIARSIIASFNADGDPQIIDVDFFGGS